LIPNEFVAALNIEQALEDVGTEYLNGGLRPCLTALLTRQAPSTEMVREHESVLEAGIRIVGSMNGGCLVIQGPPGTGKTYTASRMILELLQAGKRVGITSNSHKAITNLMSGVGYAMNEAGVPLPGIRVGEDKSDPLFERFPNFTHAASSKDAAKRYSSGLIAGTPWTMTAPDFRDKLDFLFIDEAGQVSLANAVAMTVSSNNLVLLGDQMQLEQPVQGSHPGDSGMSVLQYALKDTKRSLPDAPVYHAVVPPDYGLFLGESRRMHPAVCEFISASIYDGRLTSIADCALQQLTESPLGKSAGVMFVGVEHDGDVQRSEAEIEVARGLCDQLLGSQYQTREGKLETLQLADILFISPYNSQVTGLRAALPEGARVGSVDKFQGQEAPVCILSLCSSYGEYGSRGLGFILDRNRVNVAVSRAKCLALVVGDPRIAQSSASTLDDMVLVNLFCKIRAFGTDS
jgi:uncharacterized protein